MRACTGSFPAPTSFLPATPVMEIDPTYPYQLPYLEDFEALQIGYMQFIRGVADKRIDHRQAKLVLEALKAAGTNLRHKDRLRAKATELAARKKPPVSVMGAAQERKQKAQVKR